MWCLLSYLYSSISPRPSPSPVTTSAAAVMLFVCLCIHYVHDSHSASYWRLWLRPPHRHGWSSAQRLNHDGCLTPTIIWLMSVLLLSLSALSFIFLVLLSTGLHELISLSSDSISPQSASSELLQTRERFTPSSCFMLLIEYDERGSGLLWTTSSDDADCGWIIKVKQEMTFIYLLSVTRLF